LYTYIIFMVDKKTQKNAKNYTCEKCDYNSNNKSDYHRHLLTQKHKMYTKMDINVEKKNICGCGKILFNRQSLWRHKKICLIIKNGNDKNVPINLDNKWITLDNKHIISDVNNNLNNFQCNCGKKYKYKSGLSKHKKVCNNNKETMSLTQLNNENQNWKEMFMKVMEQNSELIEQNAEIVKQNSKLAEKPTTINNTTNNTQFNVMNYLNTECKDAMNFSDFIENFTFTLQDLHVMCNQGYQVAMEQTFIKKLQDMDKTMRPIHCSDKKRKSFYVKDNDVWERDIENKKLIAGVREIEFIHQDTLFKWRDYNEDWITNDKKQDFFNYSVTEFSKGRQIQERNKIFIKLTQLTIK